MEGACWSRPGRIGEAFAAGNRVNRGGFTRGVGTQWVGTGVRCRDRQQKTAAQDLLARADLRQMNPRRRRRNAPMYPTGR